MAGRIDWEKMGPQVKEYVKEHGVGIQKACDNLKLPVGSYYSWIRSKKNLPAVIKERKIKPEKMIKPTPQAKEFAALLNQPMPPPGKVHGLLIFGDATDVARTFAMIMKEGAKL